jgi:PA-IL-like protein
MLRKAVLAVLAVSAFAAIPASAAASTTTVVYSVTQENFDTGIAVVAGSPLVLTATGYVHLCPGACGSDPNGFNPPQYDPALTVPTGDAGGLYYRIGSGPWTLAGSGPTTISGSGELYLTTNDYPGEFGDNSGSFTVNIAPALPTSKDQCKNGGWEQYGVFKNQGDCVSFVATNGQNGPG